MNVGVGLGHTPPVHDSRAATVSLLPGTFPGFVRYCGFIDLVRQQETR